MPNPKPTHLSEVIGEQSPQGFNDGRWFLLEHQLYQVKVSLQTARGLCEQIGDRPENEEDWQAARDVLELLSAPYIAFLQAHASILSYLGGTGIAERVGGMEDG